MSSLSIPKNIQELVPYVPGKPIEETQRELGLRKVVKLASNENPLGPSPRAKEALKKYIRDLHRYPDSGAFNLRKALSKRFKRSENQFVIGNGSNEVIELLIRTLCLPGDKILTSKAAFIAYKICAQAHGSETVETHLTQDGRFDVEALKQKIVDDERIRIVFIANPNNPTGTYLNNSEMQDLLDCAEKVNSTRALIVVLDYAYWDYVTAKDLPDPFLLQEKYLNVMVLNTFSKIYGLAGMRIGFGLGDSHLLSYVERIREPFNVNSLALVGAEAALSDKSFVKESRKNNSSGMKFWEKHLTKSKIEYWPSQGNFLLANFSKVTGLAGVEFFYSCLKEGVIFRPVANYGLKNHIRISIGTEKENAFAWKKVHQIILSHAGDRAQ